ncbi:hypothetical protein EDD15DRAFT_2313417, partial [Pisolithus albus]
MPSFSLVGMLEFCQVVESLKTHAASSSLDMFDSPLTPYVTLPPAPTPPSQFLTI